MSDEEGIFE